MIEEELLLSLRVSKPGDATCGCCWAGECDAGRFNDFPPTETFGGMPLMSFDKRRSRGL
jgi:hypothetical protein